MKCKHKRELYSENRICKDCMAERETELLNVLKKVREDINWMMNEQKLLNPDCFNYLHKILDD